MWYTEWFDDELRLEGYLREMDFKGRKYIVEDIRISGEITGYKVTVFYNR